VLGRHARRPGVKRVRLRSGDVFRFRVADDAYGWGQILNVHGGCPLVAVFRPQFHENQRDTTTILSSPVALLVETMDALFRRGDWEMMGQGPLVEVPRLVFKVAIGTLDNVQLESYDRAVRRPARPEEIPLVPNRISVSPKGVERMYKALHGLAEPTDRDWPHAIESIRDRAGLL